MNSAIIEIRKKKICSKNDHSKDYMTIEFIHGLKLLSVLNVQTGTQLTDKKIDFFHYYFFIILFLFDC